MTASNSDRDSARNNKSRRPHKPSPEARSKFLPPRLETLETRDQAGGLFILGMAAAVATGATALAADSSFAELEMPQTHHDDLATLEIATWDSDLDDRSAGGARSSRSTSSPSLVEIETSTIDTMTIDEEITKSVPQPSSSGNDRSSSFTPVPAVHWANLFSSTNDFQSDTKPIASGSNGSPSSEPATGTGPILPPNLIPTGQPVGTGGSDTQFASTQPTTSSLSLQTSTSTSKALIGGNPMYSAQSFSFTSGSSAMMSQSQTVFVLDWNDGVTASSDAIAYKSEGATLELRAQVQGKEVSSYSWDLSAAPTATDITGSSTERLQLNWRDVYDALGVIKSVTNEITLTVDFTDMTQEVQTFTFEVVDDGTRSYGYSGGAALYSATWDEVLAPDIAKVWQETIGGDGFAVSAVSGELLAQYQFASYGPDSPGLGLAYQSEAASPNPIFLDRFEIDPSGAIPDLVSAQLTLDGVAGSQIYYDTSDMNPGDILQIALQGDATSLATGRYDWRIDVTAHYLSGDVDTYTTGEVTILNRSTSEAGAGWWIAGVSKVHETNDGIILDNGGQSLWFEWDSGTSSYLAPTGDFSTLVKNIDDTYTRTLETGQIIRFDDQGRQTELEDRNGNIIVVDYNGSGQVSKVTDPNGRETDFAYTSGMLTSVTDPASRVTQLAYASGMLETITSPDSTTWDFEYDGDGRMTLRTDALAKETEIIYSAAGRVEEILYPDTTSISISPFQLQGIAATGYGTLLTPATSTLLAAATSTYVDGRTYEWQNRYDWTGFGTQTQLIDPLGYLAVTVRDENGLAIKHTDTLARNTVFERDSVGNVLTVVHPDHSIETYEYNAYSQLTKHTDTESKDTIYAFDSNGNMTSYTDAMNNVTTMTYTASGMIETVTDPLSRETSFVYDAYNRVTDVILPDDTPLNPNDNPTATSTYDSAGNILEKSDPLGNVTTFTYDTMGRTTSIIMPDDTPLTTTDNPVTTFDYDDRGRLIEQADPGTNTVTTEYDDRGRVVLVTDQLNNETSYVYDATGNLTESTNALNETTTRDYDEVGNLVSITDPDGNTTFFTFDPARQLVEQEDALGNVTAMAYNTRGWLAQIDDPAGGVVNRSYNSQGWLQSVAHYGTPATTYTYNDLGQLVEIIDPLGNDSSFTYDDAGNLTSKTDPLGHTTSYTYDERNQLLTVTDELSNVTSYTYDDAGNLLSVTDPLSRVTEYVYDEQSRVISQTLPEGGVIEFAYDIVGRLIEVTDPESNVTAFAYDAAGRLLTETDPLLNTTTYTYDALGRMVGINDRNDRDRSFEYDLAGRRTAENWLDSMGSPIHTIDFAYNDAGQLTEISDAFATYAYEYDDKGRLTSVDNYGTPDMPNVVLDYVYDTRDNLTSLTDNFNGIVSYTYDNADRMTAAAMRISGSNQPKVNFTYDAASRITAINRVDETPTYWPVMSAPVNTAITYDDINRVTGIHHTKSTSPTIAQYTFDYNDASELIEEVSPSGTVDFTYDDDGQLIEANGWRNEDYTFDLNGNRTMTGYVTDDGNRLESDGTYDYTYDGEGNRLTKTTIATGDVVEYTWDYRNRLVDVVHKDGSANVLKTAEFVYDPLDKLIGRLTDSDGPGSAPVAELWTVYNGPHAHADFNGSGTLQNRYLYGTAIDMLLARVSSSGNIAWYLTDQQGSVRDIADSGGNVIDHIVYDSFGSIVSESNPSNGDRFKYTAREWEDAIDLYYYRARLFDPAVGRFISQDPLGFQAGDANLYRYVGNGPTNATDPTGMQEGMPFWDYELHRRRMEEKSRARSSPIGPNYPGTLHFPGTFDEKQRATLTNASAKAAWNIHAAYYMMTVRLDEVKKAAETKPDFTAMRLLLENQEFYISRLASAYERTKLGNTYFYGPNGLSNDDGETEAYTYPYVYWNSIMITPKFFDAHRSSEDRAGIMAHEFGRLEGITGDNDGMKPSDDYHTTNIYHWDNIITNLSNMYESTRNKPEKTP